MAPPGATEAMRTPRHGARECTSIHLLDLKRRNHHALDDIWEQRSHVVIAHGHIGNYLLERNLLSREVFILLVALELGAQLGDFALRRHDSWSATAAGQ